MTQVFPPTNELNHQDTRLPRLDACHVSRPLIYRKTRKKYWAYRPETRPCARQLRNLGGLCTLLPG
jgi:hypothetical protein